MITQSSTPAATSQAAEVLRVRGAVKRYGTFTALRGVDLTVRSGSVHALLGHNGAGKSTLIEIIGGTNQLTAGDIEFDGVLLEFSSPREANERGVSVIHQHLSLVDSLTVADNIFLGVEQQRFGVLRRSEQLAESGRLLRRVGSSARPQDLVSQLSAAQRQLVEIAKALRRDTKVLILDEPTAALSDVESQLLGSLVMQLRNEGLGIIYVTHLLQEVERLADDVTVLEDGLVSFTGSASGMSRGDLVRLISGGHSAHTTNQPASRARNDESQLAAIEAVALSGDGFGPIDLRLQPGEIVGLFGMLGSGRGELLETLAGARRPHGGVMQISGVAKTFTSPSQALRAGVQLVSADRARSGILHGLSVLDNMLVSAFPRLSRGGVRVRMAEDTLFALTSRAFALRATKSSMIGTLSGGNQQKVMLGRAACAAAGSTALLLDGPTQGVDVGARADIYHSLREFTTEKNTAVLFSSSDPEEILTLADRILVIRDGIVVSDLAASDATDTVLIALASHGSLSSDGPPQNISTDPSHNFGTGSATYTAGVLPS